MQLFDDSSSGTIICIIVQHKHRISKTPSEIEVCFAFKSFAQQRRACTRRYFVRRKVETLMRALASFRRWQPCSRLWAHSKPDFAFRAKGKRERQLLRRLRPFGLQSAKVRLAASCFFRCVSAPVASFENEKELSIFDALRQVVVCKSNPTLQGGACLIYCAQNRFGLPVHTNYMVLNKCEKRLIFREFSFPEGKA